LAWGRLRGRQGIGEKGEGIGEWYHRLGKMWMGADWGWCKNRISPGKKRAPQRRRERRVFLVKNRETYIIARFTKFSYL
jgi:hypothetical protein